MAKFVGATWEHEFKVGDRVRDMHGNIGTVVRTWGAGEPVWVDWNPGLGGEDYWNIEEANDR